MSLADCALRLQSLTPLPSKQGTASPTAAPGGQRTPLPRPSADPEPRAERAALGDPMRQHLMGLALPGEQVLQVRAKPREFRGVLLLDTLKLFPFLRVKARLCNPPPMSSETCEVNGFDCKVQTFKRLGGPHPTPHPPLPARVTTFDAV